MIKKEIEIEKHPCPNCGTPIAIIVLENGVNLTPQKQKKFIAQGIKILNTGDKITCSKCSYEITI